MQTSLSLHFHQSMQRVLSILLSMGAVAAHAAPYIVHMKPGSGLSSTAVVLDRLTTDLYLVECPDDGCEWFSDASSVVWAERDGPVEAAVIPEVMNWGLDRVDGEEDGEYEPWEDHYGEGVTLFVLDTGVEAFHSDFKEGRSNTSRVQTGANFMSDGFPANRDCHGHGTHVASIAAGRLHGVAKNATIAPVRILGCSGTGTISGVVRGIEWVTQHSAKRKVINMSIGGTKSVAMGTALAALRASGATIVVAAGNSDDDACNFSPAGNDGVIAVGSTMVTDMRSGFSNWGDCVTMFAPGSLILAAKTGGGSTLKSGTSMASPFVAGVAATIVSTRPSGIGPDELESLLVRWAQKGVIGDVMGSPNLHLVNKGSTSPPSPSKRPTNAPTPRPVRTDRPTKAPTPRPIPTSRPTRVPTRSPTSPRVNCVGLGSEACESAWNCRMYPRNYGCNDYGFCGFRTKSVCKQWSYCKWRKNYGCTHTNWCGATTEEECDAAGCWWINNECRKVLSETTAP